VDYTFQHRYRCRDISFYFKKEFMMAIILVLVFQQSISSYSEGFVKQLDYFVADYKLVLNTTTNKTDKVPTGKWLINSDRDYVGIYDFATLKVVPQNRTLD
jgi:hypothetical protein